ncbi:MAG: 2-amino-4-hydroxy-6-hydroxymethyldihydropteridine diphosphokinase [Beijerinckiaceae bacterium]
MTEAPSVAALSLGGNVGDVVASFAMALQALDGLATTKVLQVSSVWRTAPWGVTDQPDFFNLAAFVETAMTPQDLLEACLKIEKAAGRERKERWGPRTLDIDIVDFAGLRIATPSLTLPHPRARERTFVLAPLAEMDPEFSIAGEPVAVLLGAAAPEVDTSRAFKTDAPASARLLELMRR